MTCRQYGTDYVAVEDAAHQAHKGLWQGKFEIPADWRKDQKIQKLLAQRGKSASGAHCQLCQQAFLPVVSDTVPNAAALQLMPCTWMQTCVKHAAYRQSLQQLL